MAEMLIATDHSRPISRPVLLLFEQVVQTSPIRIVHEGVVPFRQQLPALYVPEQVDFGYSLSGTRDNASQYVVVMPDHPVDHRFIEQISVVFEPSREGPVLLF